MVVPVLEHLEGSLPSSRIEVYSSSAWRCRHCGRRVYGMSALEEKQSGFGVWGASSTHKRRRCPELGPQRLGKTPLWKGSSLPSDETDRQTSLFGQIKNWNRDGESLASERRAAGYRVVPRPCGRRFCRLNCQEKSLEEAWVRVRFLLACILYLHYRSAGQGKLSKTYANSEIGGG